MVPKNLDKTPEEKNFEPNFLNSSETQNNNQSQEIQPDYVGFNPDSTEQKENTVEKNSQETEGQKENSVEIEQNLDNRIQTLKKKLKQNKKKTNVIPIVKDEMTLRIEKVMEAGLEDAFKALTPLQKQEFKIKGEQTAWKIRQLLKKTKVKIKEIFKLLLEWLKILPGVNKFFLEQEAKIKADKILSLKKTTDNNK
ncbi:MAG: hypothetical protein COX80_01830 [Candidatus Magasanikbacteria bacterium CG_4_10_14_0_2_um_filter_33_14]|uniref:Uncharacterized protein n=1 Tax=Candidatus Magasanikbacteria bacterium CG_4_10_14_0_2_um_filter_33_14 TaxID=1974636 RepID=A0A2M7VB84_9BACT|nr:MAG: hypothetical protein COX80_01830 [Candidatus Magasanikbacteria bacterium CG_4_10_14_0_2_um_filter_33_14]